MLEMEDLTKDEIDILWQMYIEWCQRNNLKPKFDSFLIWDAERR